MDAKERIRKAMHQEPTDRPPCICPGGMMNMITTDLMDEANVSWPEAHLNARMMADLAEANYEKGCSILHDDRGRSYGGSGDYGQQNL